VAFQVKSQEVGPRESQAVGLLVGIQGGIQEEVHRGNQAEDRLEGSQEGIQAAAHHESQVEAHQVGIRLVGILVGLHRGLQGIQEEDLLEESLAVEVLLAAWLTEQDRQVL